MFPTMKILFLMILLNKWKLFSNASEIPKKLHYDQITIKERYPTEGHDPNERSDTITLSTSLIYTIIPVVLMFLNDV